MPGPGAATAGTLWLGLPNELGCAGGLRCRTRGRAGAGMGFPTLIPFPGVLGCVEVLRRSSRGQQQCGRALGASLPSCSRQSSAYRGILQ